MRKKVASSEKAVLLALAAVWLMVPAFGGAAVAPAATTTTTTTAPGGLGRSNSCTRSCGNISIPYPFGIEPGCYHAAWFNLTCNHSHHEPPKLFLGDGTVEVLEISAANSTVRINSPGVQYEVGLDPTNTTWGVGLPQSGPYFLSESTGMFQAMGCNIQVSIRGGEHDYLVSSCTAMCPAINQLNRLGNGSCTGISCCQARIVLGYSSYTIQTNPLPDDNGSVEPMFIYIVDRSYEFNVDMLFLSGAAHIPKALPATLDWIISSNSTCSANKTAPECLSAHSYCQDSTAFGHQGYLCKCSEGYQGNPYVYGGCKDIDECKTPDQYACYGVCKNTPGRFTCQCKTGYTGNASVPNGCIDIDECKHKEAYSCYGTCQNFQGSFLCQCPEGTYGNSSIKGGCNTIKNSYTGISIGLGVGGGTSLFLLALGGPYIMRKIKLQKVKKMKQKFFKQNHGLLLQQLISCNTDIGQRMIINLRDVEKATNNFDTTRVIGGGGHGVVFKGIIDLQVVAIKKSKIIVQREIEEFINEVAILSQVNHRNVVKLLGCCLETEVPLLVYEFISNGTLCHHLHVEGPISLPWDDRMRIAAEVAKALSYLHSDASMPIFHRDIKSSNVLLDDALTAKISDFGASRYIPVDQVGVTTAVQGTMGYLDPMYYYTGRLTDKSDVFSFGVLLIELLTRKKPYNYQSNDGGSLVSHFVSLREEGKLDDIMDPQVLVENKDREVKDVATIATLCTKLKGEDRPRMREVEMALQSIFVKRRQVANTQRSHDVDTMPQYMSTERANNEASRQYTMEEEMLLSASFPR